MLHYYLNLYNGNIDRALAVKAIAQSQFEQFERYLRNSIASLDKKGEIEASWEKVLTENLAELSIIGGLYEFRRQTTIRVNNNKKGYYRLELLKGNPNFNKKIEYQVGNNEGEAVITEGDYNNGIVYLEGIETAKFDALRWGFSEIALFPAWIFLQKGEILHSSDGIEYKIAAINGDTLVLNGQLAPGKKLFYGETEISFNIGKEAILPFQNVSVIREDADSIVFYSSAKIDENDQVKYVKKTHDFIDYNNICFEKDPKNKLEFMRQQNSNKPNIILHDVSDYDKVVVSNNIHFRINQPQQGNMEKWKIQIKEKDEDLSTENDLNENVLSPLRCFFDDTIKITDERKNEYSVESSWQDEFQLVLSRKPTEEERGRFIFKPYCFPEGSVLRVKADTNQLKRQLEAVSILKQMPHKNHEMLIRLFEDRERTRWILSANNVVINEWFVLLDDNRSGCLNQREFVRKALNTPDFAILEGPPGSGKTTVILELICQLVSKGKRVLLCGSTNVAIDNILERLIEKKNGQSALIDRIDLLPVRIGKPDRVEQNIAEYQIDNLLDESLPEEERNWKQTILLEAANLVCGTTMGIVNHPKFRERGGGVFKLTYSGDTLIVPEFDYLIIDESSKTTFQEFLVPALYAKKWILAGDVMQLSPFTDSENIVYNFKQMSLGKNSKGEYETLDSNTQQAVFYLEILKKYYHWRDYAENKSWENRFIFPAPQVVLEKMFLELAHGRIDKFKQDTIFAFVLPEEITLEYPSDDQSDTQKWEHENVLIRTPENMNPLELIASNIILIDYAIFESVIEKLPSTHAVLQKPDWELLPHAFRHNSFQQRGTFRLRGRKDPITNSFEIVEEINKDLRERTWAQEIAWRVDREHQLRLANDKRKKESLADQIDDLTPFSVDKDRFEEARNLIVAMSFPSILESLVTGIKGKKPKRPSTITEGFTADDLKPRKTTLSYQHRMHPEISAFPRERFYQSSDALLDLEAPRHIREARLWDYPRYNHRSAWVDVQSPTRGSVNIYEVEAMMRHLRYFLDYAVNHPQPEEKDWEVACLAFYRGQEKLIREGGEKRVFNETSHIDGLQALTGSKSGKSNFIYNRDKTRGKYSVNIRLHSVDRFQGHEADVVFLSMSQTQKDGFLDNPNRLNVSITRAKFQLVILGSHEYFANRSRSEDLKFLARACPVAGS